MENLLEHIARQCSLPFISDLKGTDMWKAIVSEIEPDCYPVKQWNEAISYLCRKGDILFTCAGEAKAYLLQQVSRTP